MTRGEAQQVALPTMRSLAQEDGSLSLSVSLSLSLSLSRLQQAGY